jgi:hypothetical protein
VLLLLLLLLKVKPLLNRFCLQNVKKHVRPVEDKYETVSTASYKAGFVMAAGAVIMELAIHTKSALPPLGVDLAIIRKKVAA